MGGVASYQELRRKLKALWPHLNERSRRVLAAAEAKQAGYGGMSRSAAIAAVAQVRIMKGIGESEATALPHEHARRVSSAFPDHRAKGRLRCSGE